jgi:hypothetical protein
VLYTGVGLSDEQMQIFLWQVPVEHGKLSECIETFPGIDDQKIRIVRFDELCRTTADGNSLSAVALIMGLKKEGKLPGKPVAIGFLIACGATFVAVKGNRVAETRSDEKPEAALQQRHYALRLEFRKFPETKEAERMLWEITSINPETQVNGSCASWKVGKIHALVQTVWHREILLG